MGSFWLFLLILSASILLASLRARWLGPVFAPARRFCCWIGWHSPGHLWKTEGFDGCSVHAQCPWCDYKGMIDGQGNLF